MIQVVFALVLLVLSAAVVLLFAMMGELASRVPPPEGGRRDQKVTELDGARVGRAPDAWPDELASLADAQPGLLLVLSTACGSCGEIARQLSAEFARGQGDDVAVLVSSATRDSGEEFVQRHGIGRVRYFVDEGGDWVRREFGVMASPTGLVFREGRLDQALVFQDVAALRARAAAAPAEAARR